MSSAQAGASHNGAPNLLLITTDQQRFDTIASLGNPWLDTPHLDWLRREGITFRRAYADCPICMPSRATLMTGISGTSLGLTGNDVDDYPLSRHRTLPSLLAEAGYQTHAQGKMHFEPMRARYGFQSMELPMDYYRQRRRTARGDHDMPKQHGVGENEMQAVVSTVRAADSLTHWTVRRSIDFLETRDPTAPFFMWTSFTKPHPPFDPPPEFWSLYRDRELGDPAVGTWSADPEAMEQAWLEPSYLLNHAHSMSAGSRRQSMRAYYACIAHVDYELGLLFARMRELGLLETTWLVFTSDHGEMLFDHNMGGKSHFLEGSAHVPLIVRPPANPWHPHPDAGRELHGVVSLADVAPTLLARAGCQRPAAMEGRDLLGEGGEPEHEVEDGRVVVGESGLFAAAIGPRYSYHYAVRGGAELLFDHRDDPRQERNLAAEPAHQQLRQALREHLRSELAARGSRLVAGDELKSEPALAGPGDVPRWPGFHSTDVDSDVLH